MTSGNELLLTLMGRVDASSQATALRDVIILWLAVLGRFTPLIGPSSVHSLFIRSLELNRAAFPWLPPVPRNDAGAFDFTAFEAVLQTQPSSEVMRATRALLGTYIDALFALIGPTLTAQFICSAIGESANGKSE